MLKTINLKMFTQQKKKQRNKKTESFVSTDFPWQEEVPCAIRFALTRIVKKWKKSFVNMTTTLIDFFLTIFPCRRPAFYRDLYFFTYFRGPPNSHAKCKIEKCSFIKSYKTCPRYPEKLPKTCPRYPEKLPQDMSKTS